MSKPKFRAHVSIGHNSSVIVTKDRQIIAGFEQERLDRVKSSSAQPIDAFNECMKTVRKHGAQSVDEVYLTHWMDLNSRVFDGTHDDHFVSKYFVPSQFGIEDTTKIISHTPENTHHDAHARSAIKFVESHDATKLLEPGTFVIVADGFGNDQEVISVYSVNSYSIFDLELLHRVNGYSKSLGLMYQFATSFVGMRENRDEYKFLGYESSIDEYFSDHQITELESIAEEISWSFTYQDNLTSPSHDDIINFEDLKNAREHWVKIFRRVLISMRHVDNKDNVVKTRTLIGFFVQKVLELTLLRLISTFKMRNVICSGGVFYNVKLNMLINQRVSGFTSFMPLAGDQGAAIGIDSVDYDLSRLDIGPRNFYKHKDLFLNVDNVRFFEKLEDAIPKMAALIRRGHIVNLIQESMEYGPRALGMTSSLFLPDKKIVDRNNVINDRNEVMPCAPILPKDRAQNLFNKSEIDKIVGSLDFMIAAVKYKSSVDEGTYGGVMHKLPKKNVFTGRPQLLQSENPLSKLFDHLDVDALVNTSFNYHGQPIVFDMHSIKNNFLMQCNRADRFGLDRPYLFIIGG